MIARSFCILVAGGIALPVSALTLESPVDRQVFQRYDKGEGWVKVSGTANGPVRYRIGDGQWTTLEPDAAKHHFESKVVVPSGGWYRLDIEAGAEKAIVEHFGVGEVFIIAGQSNAGNYGSEKQETKTQRVSSFNGKVWQIANDPQAGAGGNGGSFMPAFGDALVQRFDVPVGLIPLAAGGTSVREWLPKDIKFKQQTTTGRGVVKVGDEYESTGALFEKLTKPLKALGLGGFRAVLWHQGESDAGQARAGYPADRQISGEQYADFLEQIIRRSRNTAGGPVPWFTAITTYHSEKDAGDDEFRQAMRNVWAKGLAWPGPDTDTLRGDLRANVHFNGKGLQTHGEMWADKVGTWVEAMIAAPRDGPPGKEYKMVWNDEFDGPKLDETKWDHRYLGPRRGAWISKDSVTFDGKGHMLISVHKVGDEYHGGMIGTQKKKSWTYGYFECRVQVATEAGMNTAFWMQAPRMGAPESGKGAVDDTAHNGAELDILEYIARQGNVAHFNLHWNGYGKFHKSLPADGRLQDLRDGFHVYGLEWTPEGYTFYVDGHPHCHMAEAISKTEEYIILDLEVSDWAGGIANAKLPASAVFDWVRVWQKPGR